MIAKMSDGRSVELRVVSPTMGMRLDEVTFKLEDLYKLYQMKDGELKDWLGILMTRFAPQEKKHD